MAQRRNASSSGRGDGPSDLDDTRALAAKARSQTGGPVLTPGPAELSGVRPRPNSVVGARLTPPPRAASSEMPNWVWGVLGCLTVLLVGFVGLFVLARSGKLDALIGDSPPAVVTALAAPSAAEPSPAPAEPPRAAEPPSTPAPKQEAAPTPAAEQRPAAAPAAAPPAGAGPAAESKHAASSDRASSRRQARSTEGAATNETAEAEGSAKPGRAVAATPKPAADEEEDDDESPPGQDAVEAALDALATRVRGCFVKYRIKGTARVRLVATPGGTAESVNVTGEFEDTPTGMCVESVVSSAKLPSFKGPPLKLSQSYQLR